MNTISLSFLIIINLFCSISIIKSFYTLFSLSYGQQDRNVPKNTTVVLPTTNATSTAANATTATVVLPTTNATSTAANATTATVVLPTTNATSTAAKAKTITVV